MFRHSGHCRAAIFIKEARNITIEGVKILNHPDMGIVGHLSENILIDGMQVVPEPGKYCSTNTGATHFTSCSGTITIRNCTFRCNRDDCNYIYNCSRDLPDSDPSCILTSTEALETPPQANRNIIIRNNIFVTDKPMAIILNDARDVTIENNRINNDNFVKQNNCSNVIIR